MWDPPGYGFSRPPNRDYSSGFFYRDAEYAVSLMDVMNSIERIIIPFVF